jgi:hypothetical protein
MAYKSIIEAIVITSNFFAFFSEFLKNDKNLYPYDCDKKEDYIKKGLAKSRAKSKEGATTGWFAKFPQDVIRSEKMTGGDVKILEKDPYVEQTIERTNYKEIFVNPDEVAKKTSGSAKRKASSTPTTSNNSAKKKVKEAGTKEVSTPPRPISHPRFKPGGKQHQVRIMQQPSTPYHLDLQMKQEKTAASSPGAYTCHICGFAASRLNVFILHNKSHRYNYNYIPSPNATLRVFMEKVRTKIAKKIVFLISKKN